MRLLVPLLVLIFAAGVGSRRSGSGSHGSRGTSGGSRNQGSNRGTGANRGIGSKPGYGWNVGGATGGTKPGNKYVPPPGHSSSGYKPSNYKKGNVHNWNYNYPPVYVHASAPRIRNPLTHYVYHSSPGSFNSGRGYVTVHNYNYYSSKRHLPRNSAVKCSRKTIGIPPGQRNTTSSVQIEMAWACPADTVCCEWECCEKPREQKARPSGEGSRWLPIFFIVFIAAVTLVSCVWFVYCCYRESQQSDDGEDTKSTASTVYSPPPVYNLPSAYPPAPVHGAYPAGPAYPPAPAAAYPSYPPAPVPVNPGYSS